MHLRIAVDEVDLLKPAKPFANLDRSGLPHALHGLQILVGGGEDGPEIAEMVDDRLGHQTGEPRHAR